MLLPIVARWVYTLYTVVHPDLMPVIAAEERQRGMRLSGRATLRRLLAGGDDH